MKIPFTMGADPEYFLQKDGSYIAAPHIVKGTKDKPIIMKHGGGLQHDNVAVEVAIPYAKTCDEFIMNVANAFKDMNDYLPDDINIVVHPSAFFPIDQLTHPAALEFGCHPDMNAWLREENIPPAGCAAETFRSCGGHAHLGWVTGGLDLLKDDEGKFQVIRMCDATFGIVSTLLDNSKAAIERRKLYGKAGCMRATDYGVEYRSMSNYWTKNPLLVGLMWHIAEDTLFYMDNYKYKDLLKHMGHDDIQSIINEGDVEGAEFMMENYVNNIFSDETQELFVQAEEVMESAKD
jgi:hypothetical protein